MLIGNLDIETEMYYTATTDETVAITSMNGFIEAKEAYWQAVSERDYYKGKAEAYEKVLMMGMPMIVMKGETK